MILSFHSNSKKLCIFASDNKVDRYEEFIGV